MKRKQTRLQERQFELLFPITEETRGVTKLLADTADVDIRTVQRWINGQLHPGLPHLKRILCSIDVPAEIKAAFIDLIAEGSGYILVSMTDKDLDADHNGKVDCGDAMMHCANSSEFATICIRNMVQAMADGTITREEYDNCRRNIISSNESGLRALKAMDMGYESLVKRYKAKTPLHLTESRDPSDSTDGCTGGTSQAQG